MIQLAAVAVVAAAVWIPGPIVADVLSVYDGDTFTANAHVWPGVTVRVKVRPQGVDAPEINGKCGAEKLAAVASRDYVRGLIGGMTVELRDVRRGKYAGRVLASVTFGGRDLSAMIIAAGHGRAYDGGKRRGWC